MSSSSGFVAPDKIDSKFFDPKYAFKEVEVQAKTVKELIPVKKPKACILKCLVTISMSDLAVIACYEIFSF